MLLGLAAKQLGVPVSQLEVANGVVSVKGDASKSVGYGALLGGKTFSAPNTGRAPLKPVSEYKLVGKRTKRKDTVGKVDGSHPYVHALRLPGMLHGRVVRPRGQGPYGVIDKPLKVDLSSIKNIKGVKVVRKGDFIGVVSKNEQDAIQAATQLKVTWAESKTMPGNGNLWKFFREVKTSERFTRNTGSIDNGVRNAAAVREASYSVSYQAHASLGPSAGVAVVNADGATVWGASQGIYSTRTTIAGLLGLPQEKVKVIFAEGAGCYGRNLQDDAACAAALMSQLAGAPVRVQLTRDQEHGWEFYGPATLVDIRGAVDANGKITAYDYVSFQQPWVFSEATEYMSGRPLSLGGFGGADAENAGSQYKITNHRILGRSIPNDSGLPKVAYLRAPAAPQALFASEQMIDELAHAASMDPVAFRKQNIENVRWLGALEAAAKAADWKPRVAGLESRHGAAAQGSRHRHRRLRQHVRRHRRGDRGRHGDGQDPRQARLCSAGLRADHQPEHGRAADRGLRDPGCQPGDHRAGDVLEEPRHLARLGVVPDPPLQGRAGDHDRAPEPAGAPLQRVGRAGDRSGRRRDRKRVLRRDREAHPDDADDAGPRARGAEGVADGMSRWAGPLREARPILLTWSRSPPR